MAWIKFKDVKGNVYTMPKSVFDSKFATNSSFTLVQESKPAPINEEKNKEEIVKDEQIHEHKQDENNTARKGSKKANS